MLTPEHMRTKHGYSVDEVASAVQKCIRRGNEEAALYWSWEMIKSPNPSHHTHLWNRLKVIASEDVGEGDRYMPILIDVLWRNWKAKKSEHIFTVNAVTALVRAKKSRINDNAINMIRSEALLREWDGKPIPVEYLDAAGLVSTVPPVYDKRSSWEFADKHTIAGKKAGLGKADFYQRGARLGNKAPIPDPYEKRAIEADLEVERRQWTDS